MISKLTRMLLKTIYLWSILGHHHDKNAVSEKAQENILKLRNYSDEEFKCLAEEFAQTLYAQKYEDAYQYFSTEFRDETSLDELTNNYLQFIEDSEFDTLILSSHDNYRLMYEKESNTGTMGREQRMDYFSNVSASICMDGSKGDWSSWWAYFIFFTVENDALKISEIDFFGHH